MPHHINRSKERESRSLPWVSCWCPQSPSLRWRGSNWEISHPELLHALIDLWCEGNWMFLYLLYWCIQDLSAVLFHHVLFVYCFGFWSLQDFFQNIHNFQVKFYILTWWNHFCTLLLSFLQDGFSSGSVNGGVVFVAREVTGALLRWCYSSQEERDTVLNLCLALLHHTLEASDIGEFDHGVQWRLPSFRVCYCWFVLFWRMLVCCGSREEGILGRIVNGLEGAQHWRWYNLRKLLKQYLLYNTTYSSHRYQCSWLGGQTIGG